LKEFEHMKRFTLIISLFALIAYCSCSYPWGDKVHKLISRLAVENLPPELRSLYEDNLKELEKLSNKPDEEARKHPEKRHHHYVDIEKLDSNYLRKLKLIEQARTSEQEYRELIRELDQAFFADKTFPYPDEAVDPLFSALPDSIEEFEKKFKPYEIEEIGTGIYQISIHCQKLAQAFYNQDNEQIIRHTGYLSHFVADMHQPFHCTANYKGQYTGNRTLKRGVNRHIHLRYEIGLPERNWDKMEAAVKSRMRPAKRLKSGCIESLTLDLVKHGYKLTGEIVAADNAYFETHTARKVNWSRYYSFMYEKVGSRMEGQIADAANLLADLILTASEPEQAQPEARSNDTCSGADKRE